MMLLIDSHVLIWYVNGDTRLPQKMRSELENVSNALYISVGTFWELTMKESIGKLSLANGVAGLYEDWIVSQAATLLNLDWNHLRKLRNLPWLHRDPFDRLLVAQALATDMVLLTHDERILQYPGLKKL